ncbi:hypothetical protein FRC20_000266, partial [Serendipita sp. 405]
RPPRKKRKLGPSLSEEKTAISNDSDSEASLDEKQRKVRHKPRFSDPSDGLYARSETVEALYNQLKEHKFIFVRGTPASGKSSLAYLLRKYINDNHPDQDVCLVPRYRQQEERVTHARKWLELQGWNSAGVLILDEAQLSYWDNTLWDIELKPIHSNTPYMIILFASYGSAGRDLSANTPFRVKEEQLVGLARGPNSSVGLLLTREEMQGVVKKKFLDHYFDKSLLEYVYSLTSGHVGAYCDTLEVVKRDETYREMKSDHRKYTYDDFLLNFDMSAFLQGLSDHSVFSRGLPTRDDLNRRQEYVESLGKVLQEPLRFVLVKEEDDRHGSKNPLRRCLERGWLFSERADGGNVKYRFASQLHERYTEWLLLRREDPIKDPNLRTFVINVIKNFSPQNLQTRGDLRTSSSPQSIPEAQFQQEFYRACAIYTRGCVTNFPECGTAKGRIDYFIRSKKWGVEILRNGVRILEHDSRFTTGEYGEWIKDGKMDDFIMIDFRSNKPTKRDIKNLIYVVSTDSWETLQICNHETEVIETIRLVYH